MLDDKDLEGLRGVFSERILAPMRDHALPGDDAWTEFVFDPKEATARAIMDDKSVPENVRLRVVDLMIEVGVRHVADVLAVAPLPLDDVPDRRWQLRRELSKLVDRMSVEDLQRAVWHAHALVGPEGSNGQR